MKEKLLKMSRARSSFDYLLPVLPFFVLFLFFSPKNFTLQDLTIYRQAGVALIAGENPYELPQMRHYGIIGLGGFDEGVLQIWTPPIALFLPALLGMLTLGEAKYLWAFVFCANVFLSAMIYRRQAGLNQMLPLLIAAWALCLSPLLNGLMWGSVAPFQAISFFSLVLLLSCQTISRGKAGKLGLALFSMSFKPQLTVGPLMKYVIAAARNPLLFRTILLALVGLLATVAISLYHYPSLLADYLKTNRTEFFSHAPFTVSLPAILNAQPWVNVINFYLLVAIFLALFGLWHKVTKGLEIERQLVEYSPLSFLIIPYCWGHDFIILMPWLSLVVADHFREAKRIPRLSFQFGLVLWSIGQVILFSPDAGFAHYWAKYPMFLGLAIWLLLRFYQLRVRSDGTTASPVGEYCCPAVPAHGIVSGATNVPVQR